MTAILKDLRELDQRLARGEITDVEYTAQRVELMDSADVIETEFVEITPGKPEPTPKRPAPAVRAARAPVAEKELSTTMSWGFGVVLGLGVVGVCLCFAMLVFGDINLALTLGVTILAALTVALFRSLEE